MARRRERWNRRDGEDTEAGGEGGGDGHERFVLKVCVWGVCVCVCVCVCGVRACLGD